MRKVFISYSHEDEEWKDRLVKHLRVLELERDCYIWSDTDIEEGDDWLPRIESALNEADIIVLMISPDFIISKFIREVEIPKALERREKDGVKIIPLLLKPCLWKLVGWLSPMQIMPRNGIPLIGREEVEIESQLVELADKVYSFKKVIVAEYPKPQEVIKTSYRISLSKLPATGVYLFGREMELKVLDAAWDNDGLSIIALVAWGGVGKTSLVNHWLDRMAKDNYRGAQRVYGWSFYSQGAEEGRQASADAFLQETLTWFGDETPEEGSTVEKGRRLARRVKQNKTLLVLDGLEPMQYPPGEVQGWDGKCKDQGLRTFLRELAGGMSGLCLISSRESLTDLTDKRGDTVEEKNLERLSNEAGTQLLKKIGVTGPEKSILEAVTEYDGHALALTMLGRYILSHYGGDIRNRDRIPHLMNEHIQGGHARRVMAAYEQWFTKPPKLKYFRQFKIFYDISAELNILYMMGLFDRPVEKGAIDALIKKRSIRGVTDKLKRLTEEQWQLALTHLRDAGLLGAENIHKLGTLDCHPLVREHFGEQLKRDNPAGWREANKRLYHYYKDLPKKILPDTLSDMEPLFAAVAHGCRAGLYLQAEMDVFWKRIVRGEEGFIFKKLGAFGSYLSVLSHFFAKPWGEPAEELPEEEKTVIFGWAAFGLRAVGRLPEAVQPMKAGLKLRKEQKNWKECAIISGNLSELLLTLGRVADAVDLARQSVRFADQSGDEFQRMNKRTTLGETLHHAGELEEAEQWFLEAEAPQKEHLPENPFLSSLEGYRFCDLLLGRGQWAVVAERVEQTLKWTLDDGDLLSISFEHLTMGRAGMLGVEARGENDFNGSLESLHRAVAGLRESGYQDMLPLALFARAACYRLMGDFAAARDDLDEAEEIARLGSMKRHLVDYHLEAARLADAMGKSDAAEKHYKKAGELVEETGYKRRLGEVKG